jgi:hypothetical protein
MSGARASPLEPLLSIQGVRGAVVFDEDGRIISLYPENATISPWVDPLKRWFERESSLLRRLRELVVFYPKAMIFWRKLEKVGKPSGGLGTEGGGPAEPREERGSKVLVVIGDATSSASLVRLNLDVMEHSWKSQGIDRVLSQMDSGVSGGGFLGKILRRRKP